MARWCENLSQMFFLVMLLLPRAALPGLTCQEACTACDDHVNRGTLRQLYCTMCNECVRKRSRRRSFSTRKNPVLARRYRRDDYGDLTDYGGLGSSDGPGIGYGTRSTMPPILSSTNDPCVTPDYCRPCTDGSTTPGYCQTACIMLATCANTPRTTCVTTTTCRPTTKPKCAGVCLPLCQCPTDNNGCSTQCNTVGGGTGDLYVGVPKNRKFNPNNEQMLRMLLERNARRNAGPAFMNRLQ